MHFNERSRLREDFSDKDLHDLRRLLQQAALQGYPNPERRGCPGTKILEEIAGGAFAFEHSAYAHLKTCSPCLKEMLDLRQRKILEQQRVFRIRRRTMLYASVAAALALILGAFVIHQRGTGLAGSSVTVRPNESAALIIIDLSKWSRTRGADTELPLFRIPATVVNLRIVLPFGSDDGRYDIEIHNETDRVISKATGLATIADGDTKASVYGIDLAGVPAGRYELFFRHADASWQHVPIVVG